MRLGAPVYTWGEVSPSNLYTIGAPVTDALPPVFNVQPSPPDNLYHALEDPAIAPSIVPAAPAASSEPAAAAPAAKPSIAPVVWYAAGALALKLLIFS